MVVKSDTTQILTQSRKLNKTAPSFKRWLKHFCYLPISNRYFSKQDQANIAQAVAQAEEGHIGEIQVVIEGHIPCTQAYYQNTRHRAEQLFAELYVWDTSHNSGILLYLNLCEHQVELVVDRGICAVTHQDEWQKICQQITDKLKQKQNRQALVDGILAIGVVLQQFYGYTEKVDKENELNNAPIIIN